MLTDEEINGLAPGDLLWFGSLLVIVAEGVHEIDNDTGYGRQIIRVIAPGESEVWLVLHDSEDGRYVRMDFDLDQAWDVKDIENFMWLTSEEAEANRIHDVGEYEKLLEKELELKTGELP